MAGILERLGAFFNPPHGQPSVDDVPYGQVWMVEDRSMSFEKFWGAGLDDDFRGNTASGEQVSQWEEAFRLIAFQAGVRLLTNDIGSLPTDAYRGSGTAQVEISKPSFMLQPNAANPNYLWEDYLKQLVFGILTEGEVFVRAFPDTRNTASLAVFPASSITDITFDGGSPLYHTLNRTFTPDEMVHIPWFIPPGKLRGVNPVEAAKEGLGIGIASDKFVGSYFGNGAILSGVINFPPGVEPTKDQVKEMKGDFTRKHVGARKSHAVGALTGGATFQPFDYNNRNAQLLELRDAVIEDTARLLGIPPHMLGSQKPGAVAYASVEQRSIDYVTHAVLPITIRIERAHTRLLRGPETFIKLNVKGLLRGDEAARAQFYNSLLQNKVIRREEVRSYEDLPYDPESVGYLETPNNNAPDASAEPAPPQRSTDVIVNAGPPQPEPLDRRVVLDLDESGEVTGYHHELIV